MAEHNEIGKIGENITDRFLRKDGFTVIERNYRTKFGEIDSIARKDNVLHFIEVKSVKVRDVTVLHNLYVQPQENLTIAKWSKLVTTIEIYLQHRNISHETKYQVDLACVYIDTESRQGKVVLVENVHVEK
jgi:putative endonuclease